MVNGARVAQLDARDRGLQYGDGVFETMAVQNGVVQFFDAHFERLQQGCNALGIPVQTRSVVQQELTGFLAQNQIAREGQAVVKLVITRGTGERGYAPPIEPDCNRILYLSPWPDSLEEQSRNGVAVKFCRTRLGLNPGLAGIKHLNRLEQVLAAQELTGTPYVEGVMLDTQDNVTEATRSNIFAVEKGRIITPALEHCGVAGITRARVLRLARANGLQAGVEVIERGRLAGCNELFLSNSIVGVVPVTLLEQQRFKVGAVTRRLQNLLLAESGQ